VQWTREDDVKFSYYNAASSQYLKASLGANKLPTALLQRSALTSFFGTLLPNYSTPDLSGPELEAMKKLRSDSFGGGVYPYASGIERAQGLEDMPYEIPNLRLENCKAENHIRVGWMRSVANVYHAFAINSFAGELAIAAGRDQKDYLLDLIGTDRFLDEKVMSEQSVERFRNNELPLMPIEVPVVKGGKANQVVAGFPPDTSRLRAVIKKVAEDSDWMNTVAKYKNMKGRGLGIAAHRSFLSYVAVVVDVTLTDDNKLTINDVYATIHCGLAVNRDRVLAQMEGGVVYGLSYALLGEITVKNGAVVQNNFDDYPVLRIHQTPRIHLSIIDSLEAPTGVGEPPTPAVAPALANAIAAAGGPRIRAIPFATKKEEGSKDEKIELVLT
jgi:isoquinoline 1-oxidoreductase beta subunit